MTLLPMAMSGMLAIKFQKVYEKSPHPDYAEGHGAGGNITISNPPGST